MARIVLESAIAGRVRVEGSQARKWADLVRLWQAFNHHLAHVMETASRQPSNTSCATTSST